MEAFRAQIKDLGNPLKLLGLDESANPGKKEIKTAYKVMALKWHPDKNSDDTASVMFNKINLAYKILSDPSTMKMFSDYQQTFVDSKKRVDDMSATQRKFYDDLQRREAEAKVEEEERKKQKIRDLLKQQEKLKKAEEERVAEEKQYQQKKAEKLKAELANGHLHAQLNSIKVKWSKKLKVSYNERILSSQFRAYGPIKQVDLIEGKRTAIIEFLTATAAESAVNSNKQDGSNDDADDDDSGNNGESDQIANILRVKYLLKPKQRADVLAQIEDKTKPKQESKDMSLSSNNLSKIADILSRSSKPKPLSAGNLLSGATRKAGIQESVSELKRQHDRKKFIQECIDQDD